MASVHMATNSVSPDLAGCRRSKGISLHQIAEITKIGVHYLEAIERGQFAKLPGGVYNTSYLRQYARIVDCDEANLLAYYHGSQGAATAQG